MATEKCTCRTTRRERHLEPEYPVHGDAEEQRRHQAANFENLKARFERKLKAGESAEAEWRELWASLDEDGKRFMAEMLHAFAELDDDEKAAMEADVDATHEVGNKIGVVQMHRTMAKLKRDDPERFAETAEGIGWEGRIHG